MSTSSLSSVRAYLPAEMSQELQYECDKIPLRKLIGSMRDLKSGKHGVVKRIEIEGQKEVAVQRMIVALQRYGIASEVVDGSDGKPYLQVPMARQYAAWANLESLMAPKQSARPENVIVVDGVEILPGQDKMHQR